MSSKLLDLALTKNPETVLDLGVGRGDQAKAFIAHGANVHGVDVKDSPHEHERYTHIQTAIEFLEPTEDTEPYDLIWCSNVLQLLPNVQAFLVQIEPLLKDEGWLCIAVPANTQDRLHIGNLTLWTPAHLIYNLICAGWDCSEAKWYTSYETIGLCVQKKRIEDMSWRTGHYFEEKDLNEYTPVTLKHESGAWLANNWPVETDGRVSDPPLVTAGVIRTNLPPKTQLAFGPNPKLREKYEQDRR